MVATVHHDEMTPLPLAVVIAAMLGTACGTSSKAPAPVVSVAAPAAPCVPAWLSVEMTDVMEIDVVGDQLFWVEFERGRIQRMPLAGGPPIVVVPGEAGSNVPEIVVVGDRITWLRGDGSLWSVPIAGGEPESIADGFGTPHSLRRAGDELLVSSSAGLFRVSSWAVARIADEAASISIDGEDVYVEATAPAPCTGDCRAIVRVPIDGGEPTTVALVGADVSSLLVDRDRVLFGWDSVRSTAKRGGQELETLATGVFLVRNLQTVADRVYFTADNVVYQLRDGAFPIALAQRNPITDLEIAGEAIYTSVLNVGIRRQCHVVDGPGVAVQPRPAPSCKPGLVASRDGMLDTCVDPHGPTQISYRYWYQSGHVAEQGELGGLDESFYTDGTKHHEARVGVDLEHPGAGPSRRWYATGQLAEEGAYDASGQKDGRWTTYAPDGTVRTREDWDHGELR